MKNIWKVLIGVVLALSLTACAGGGDDDDDDDDGRVRIINTA